MLPRVVARKLKWANESEEKRTERNRKKREDERRWNATRKLRIAKEETLNPEQRVVRKKRMAANSKKYYIKRGATTDPIMIAANTARIASKCAYDQLRYETKTDAEKLVTHTARVTNDKTRSDEWWYAEKARIEKRDDRNAAEVDGGAVV
jgi:hypothetical protein